MEETTSQRRLLDSAEPLTSEAETADALEQPVGKQSFTDRKVHGWYNSILGFSDQLVVHVLDRMNVGDGQQVLDPFCGTGTTLVECMKRGIDSIGIDANPFSCFVSRVKTNPRIDPDKLSKALDRVQKNYRYVVRTGKKFKDDSTHKYLVESGMLDRGWICAKPLRKALSLKSAIKTQVRDAGCRNAMLLALASELPTKIANMKFGPEIYCGPPKDDLDLVPGFRTKIESMINDLEDLQKLNLGNVKVHKGDARYCNAVLKTRGPYQIDAAICSPPYPTEHDYTRNSRLELAFLDYITTNDCVRSIKQTMIRSHTKGIYKTDTDAKLVSNNEEISQLAARIKEKSDEKSYGFARLYPVVVQEYFGGMKRHLMSLNRVLKPESPCAYVVGDQASYFGIKIPTASILASLAEEAGFDVEDISLWRQRWATATSKMMNEHILILRKRPV